MRVITKKQGGAKVPYGQWHKLDFSQEEEGEDQKWFLTLFVHKGRQICPPLSYFNIAPKLKESLALMHPDFE